MSSSHFEHKKRVKNDKNLAHFFASYFFKKVYEIETVKLQMNAMNVMWQPVGGLSLFTSLSLLVKIVRNNWKERSGEVGMLIKNLKHFPVAGKTFFRLFSFRAHKAKIQ